MAGDYYVTLHQMPYRPRSASLVIEPRTTRLADVREFVSQQLQDTSLSPPEWRKVVLAVDEAVANVIEHGYHKSGVGSIEVICESHATHVDVIVLDEAPSFDPRTAKGAAPVQPNARGHVHRRGLGIALMRRIMDRIDYSRPDGVHNQLRLIKFYGPGDAGPDSGRSATPGRTPSAAG